MAENIKVFLAPSNASGLPELVIYLKPPHTKYATATRPASVTNIEIIALMKDWIFATSADCAYTGEATANAVRRTDENIINFFKIVNTSFRVQKKLPCGAADLITHLLICFISESNRYCQLAVT